MSFCLVCDSSIVATCPSVPAARFAFVCVLLILFLLFVAVLSDEPKQNQGRGLVDRKLVEGPQLFHCWSSQGGTSVLSPLGCSFFSSFSFLVFFIAVVSIMSV